jgi:hypothetical protein
MKDEHGRVRVLDLRRCSGRIAEVDELTGVTIPSLHRRLTAITRTRLPGRKRFRDHGHFEQTSAQPRRVRGLVDHQLAQHERTAPSPRYGDDRTLG